MWPLRCGHCVCMLYSIYQVIVWVKTVYEECILYMCHMEGPSKLYLM